jgi:hypothetical protein
MNADITRQTEEFLKAAREVRIPENVQSMIEDGVARGRKAVDGIAEATKSNVKVAEDVMSAVQAGAKAIGEKVIENTRCNTDAMLNATAEIIRAKSLPEAARLQGEFVRSQLTTAGTQTQELFQLYANVTRATLEQINAAAGKAFESARKVA